MRDSGVRSQELEERQLDLDGMFGDVRLVIHLDRSLRDLPERLRCGRIDRHIAEGRAKRARFPEGDAGPGVADAGVVWRQNEDQAGDRNAAEDAGGSGTGVHVASMGTDYGDRPSGRLPVRPSGIGEQGCHRRPQFHGVFGIEATADGGRPDAHSAEGTPGQR